MFGNTVEADSPELAQEKHAISRRAANAPDATLPILFGIILLILVYTVLGTRSQAFMDMLFKWLKKNAETILIIVFVVFGLYFLVKGITALAT